MAYKTTPTGDLVAMQPANPALRRSLGEGRVFLENLRKTLATLRTRGDTDTPEFQQLSQITDEVADFVKQAWLKLNQAYIVPPGAVSSLIQSGDLNGAAQTAAAISRDCVKSLKQSLADIEELQKWKPVALPPGTNLATAGPSILVARGKEPPAYFDDFAGSHPVVQKLASAQQLRHAIAAGDNGAKAQMAMLTALAEYGDRLLPPMPDMRVRPAADSPYLPVYERVKSILENFKDSRIKGNLLSPGRVSHLLEAHREFSIKDIVASLQTHYAVKQDALRIATELRDALETYIHNEFAPTPECSGLIEAIKEGCKAQDLAFSDIKANLLVNPHLNPARCIAGLAALISADSPGQTTEQCLDRATGIREHVNVAIQSAIQAVAAQLYRELGGDPAVFAVETLSVGNMVEAAGIPLATGRKPGTPDYIALFNYDYTGKVVLDAQHGPRFVSPADEKGKGRYKKQSSGLLGRGAQTALHIQPIGIGFGNDCDDHPSVTIVIAPHDRSVATCTVEYRRQENGIKARVPDLPAGVTFDCDKGFLNLGPGYKNGETYTVELGMDENGTSGNFSIVVSKTIAPQFCIQAVDLFDSGQNTIREGAHFLTDVEIRALADWLRKGAALEFSALVAEGVNPVPEQPTEADFRVMNVVRLLIELQLSGREPNGSVSISIRSFTDPVPKDLYKAVHDPAGHIGLCQDRTVAVALAIVAGLRLEFAGDEQILAPLEVLESDLQMKLIRQPAKS